MSTEDEAMRVALQTCNDLGIRRAGAEYIAQALRTYAREEVNKALEAVRVKLCIHCAGMSGYSTDPKMSEQHGELMHLAKGFPPRVCNAASVVRSLKTDP